MVIRDFIIYACLIVYILYITKINNMWGVSRGSKKAKADVKLEKIKAKNRMRTLKLLTLFANIDKSIGFSLNEYKQKDYKYKIERLRWKIKSVERAIKPSELSGLFKLIQILGVFIAVFGFIATYNILFMLFLLFLFTPAIFHTYATAKIQDEDMKIEEEFPDLFIILYNRLLQGTNARLSPTLKDFLVSIDSVKDRGSSKIAIKNFVLDLRNNIEIYGDDGIAVMKLREKYNSVMIINFCNLAVQALNGVNNSDKLLAFKIELNGKRVEQMKERAAKMVKKGSRAVLVVYVILFEFILLSWIAKLSQAGGIGSLFR